MKDFRKLSVWTKSHKLTLEVYKLTDFFPTKEEYGLKSQLRRAVVSIPTNIAEGCGRGSDVDFKRFLQIAFGSANEVEYLILLSKDLSYISEKIYVEIISELEEIKKMLSTLIKKISFDNRR
jgi:four helix bundle protein